MIAVRQSNPRGATPDTTPAAVSNRVIDTPRVYTVFISNQVGSLRYAQVFDLAALPNDGTVPFIEVNVAANGQASIVWPNGRSLENGCVVASSSTQGTLTITTADLLIDVTHD